MATTDKTGIQASITAGIRTGGSDTTALELRSVLNEILDSYVNVIDGGFVYQSEVGYSSLLTLSNDKSFVYKKYVDDLFSSISAPALSGVLVTGNTMLHGQSIVSVDGFSKFIVNDGIASLVLDLGDGTVSDFVSDPTFIRTRFKNNANIGGIFKINASENLFKHDVQNTFDSTLNLMKGLAEYDLDYSSSYTNRSLIDKEYADNLFTSVAAHSLTDVLTTGNVMSEGQNIQSATGANYFVVNNSVAGLVTSSNNGFLIFDTFYGGFRGFQYGTAKNVIQHNTLNEFTAPDNNFYGNLTATTLIKSGGTSLQFLKADGSVDSSTYLTTSVAASTYLSLSGGTLTGNLNGVTPTELGYISGVTSNIQNQINNINAGFAMKIAARALVDTNINISSAPSTIDSLVPTLGERYVLNGQTTSIQNGVYVFNGIGSAMTRATDCATGTALLGMTITIQEGTYADQIWMLITNSPITVGSTSLMYAKSSNTTYSGSNGILLTGNNFTIDNTWFGGDATINSSGVIAIGAGKVTNTMLAGSIAYSKLILTGSVTNSDLVNSSLTVNGSSISLGGSATITANTTNALTVDNSSIQLDSGTTFNGSAARTISVKAGGITNSMLAGSIAASKLVGTDISTVGTITSGTWNGTKIGIAYGGTNLSTIASGSLLVANSLDILTALTSTSGNKELTNDSGVIAWTTVTGTGSPVRGTSPTITSPTITVGSDATGDIYYNGGSGVLTRLAAGVAGTFLRFTGTGAAPVVSTLILPNSATANQVIYATATNTHGSSANLQFDGTQMGIGGTPVSGQPITSTSNSNAQVLSRFINSSTGTAAQSSITVQNSSVGYFFTKLSTGYTTAGLLSANLNYLAGNGGDTLYTNLTSSTAHIWSVGGAATANEVMRLTTGLVTLKDATDIGISATTGSKIGQSTSKIGIYGVTPIVRPTVAGTSAATITPGGGSPINTGDTFGTSNWTFDKFVQAVFNTGLLTP